MAIFPISLVNFSPFPLVFPTDVHQPWICGGSIEAVRHMAPAFERLQEVVIEVTYWAWGHGFPAWCYVFFPWNTPYIHHIIYKNIPWCIIITLDYPTFSKNGRIFCYDCDCCISFPIKTLLSNHVVIVECFGIPNCFFFCFFWELGMISGDFWQTFVDLLENAWPKIWDFPRTYGI